MSMVMNGEPPADAATDTTQCQAATDTTQCQHETRMRENLLGFASPETVCVECGQSFDAEEEQELRHRDQSSQRVTTRVISGKGYLVG
jgi:hypothetical protein